MAYQALEQVESDSVIQTGKGVMRYLTILFDSYCLTPLRFFGLEAERTDNVNSEKILLIKAVKGTPYLLCHEFDYSRKNYQYDLERVVIERIDGFQPLNISSDTLDYSFLEELTSKIDGRFRITTLISNNGYFSSRYYVEIAEDKKSGFNDSLIQAVKDYCLTGVGPKSL